MRERPFFLWGAVLLVLLCARAAAALDVVLTVREPVNVARTSEVVTTGVPLPIGMQTANWHLRDSTDAEIPVSIDVLPGRNPWLLVQFQSTNTGNQTKTYTLRDTAKTATLTTPIVLVEDGTSFVVTTGKIKATIMKGAAYSGLEQVIYDANANGTYADPAEVIVGAPAAFATIVNTQDGLTYTGDGNVTATSLDYNNAHRAVIRVDGQYKNGSTVWLTYTTRYTFKAGSPLIEVEHILRNNLQTNKRDAKFTSAPLVIGGGGVSAVAFTIGDRAYYNVGTTGLTFQILPPTPYGINTATNGGLPLPDLSNWTSTLFLDFETGLSAPTITSRTSAARNPMMALAPPRWFSDNNALSTERFSTTDDEKAAYTQWGWTHNPASAPCDTSATDTYFVSWLSHGSYINIHDDTEVDDVWQNLLMYIRTGGCRGYFNRTRAWVRYQRDEYAFRTEGFPYAWDGSTEGPTADAPTDPYVRPLLPITLTAIDISYLGLNADGTCCPAEGAQHHAARVGKVDARTHSPGCHMYGWGLIDWYYLTGEKEALQAAKDLGEISERMYQWRATGYDLMVSGTRFPARHLELTARLMEATQGTADAARWATHGGHMSRLIVGDSISWSEWDGGTSGFYSGGLSYVEGATCGAGNGCYTTLNTRGMSGHERVILVHAMWRYYRLIGDTAEGLVLKDRIIKNARYSKLHALHPVENYASNSTFINYATVGNTYYGYYDRTPKEYQQAPQSYHSNVLSIGYRLTGDTEMLTLARGLWNRWSHTLNGYPPPPVPPDPGPVSQWFNQSFLGDKIYRDNCCAVYASLLFSTAVDNPTVPSQWTQQGGTYNIDTSPANGWGNAPDIAVDTAGDIYVASTQQRNPDLYNVNGEHGSKIGVAKWNGTTVSQVGTPLGHLKGEGSPLLTDYPDSWAPSIVTIGTTPYVAWYEGNAYSWQNSPDTGTSVFVAQWTGSAWDILEGTRANGALTQTVQDEDARQPSLANIGGVLYCAWSEENSSNQARVAVMHWNGSAWVADGTPFAFLLSSQSHMMDLSIFDVGGVPHVAWQEWRRNEGSNPYLNSGQGIRVKKFTAGAWSDVGTTLSTDWPNYLATTSVGTTPYVVWQQKTITGPYQLFGKYFNGTSWVAMGAGTALNVNTTAGEAGRPALSTDGTNIWAAWAEWMPGVKSRMYVRKYTVSTNTWDAVEGPINANLTTTAARAAAVTVRSGVPYVAWSQKDFPSQTAQIVLYGRNGTGTGTLPTLSGWGTNGATPVPIPGTWVKLTPGGIVGNGGTNITSEGYANFLYIPALGQALVHEIYHAPQALEVQNALLAYTYATNRWDLVEVTESAISEHMTGIGHTEGQMAAMGNELLAYGNNTLNNEFDFQTHLYDPVAGHGKKMFPPNESRVSGNGICAWDSDRNEVMCVGDTIFAPWVYSRATNQWSAKNGGPSARVRPSLVYDRNVKRFVLFGGRTSGAGTDLGDTWEFDPAVGALGQWVQYTPTPAPPAKFGASFAYDAVAKKSLLVAGRIGSSSGTNTVFTYDATTHTWTQIGNLPSELATQRVGNYLTYNEDANVHMIFSGVTGLPVFILRLQAGAPSPLPPSKLEGRVVLSGETSIQ